ncbi:hypothetical protein B0H15DRAFT_955773 [Mycena belliarum]|uniref:Uncharacterized protein n=1 Tax=Mycena belliarum TaxID=1033014 RepID=A0AAD6TVT5_9AGAR|nr:hypothetical protein B0H15DRAFT_955773 [Mycena belliae]
MGRKGVPLCRLLHYVWPPSVTSFSQLEDYLLSPTTVALHNTLFGVDFHSPDAVVRVHDETVYTNDDRTPWIATFFGQVKQAARFQGNHRTFFVHAGEDAPLALRKLFQCQLAVLQCPVIQDDDDDLARGLAPLVDRCTDGQRYTGQNARNLEVPTAHCGGRPAPELFKMSLLIKPKPHQAGAPSLAFENATALAAADGIVEHDDDATLVETETCAVGVGPEANNRAFFNNVFRDTHAFIDEYNSITTAHPYIREFPEELRSRCTPITSARNPDNRSAIHATHTQPDCNRHNQWQGARTVYALVANSLRWGRKLPQSSPLDANLLYDCIQLVVIAARRKP